MIHFIYTKIKKIELLVIHAAGVYFFMNYDSYLMKLLGLTLLGLGSGRCGWLMHEGGHYSMTGNISTDRFLQIIIFGIGCGMSGAWWRNQHNKHHATPQKLKHDVDLDTLPLIAFNGMCLCVWEREKEILLPIIKKFLARYILIFKDIHANNKY
jgi:hypothetical protein